MSAFAGRDPYECHLLAGLVAGFDREAATYRERAAQREDAAGAMARRIADACDDLATRFAAMLPPDARGSVPGDLGIAAARTRGRA